MALLVVFPGLFFAFASCGAQEPSSPLEPQQIGRKVGEGEQCLVCEKIIDDGKTEVVEFRYKGRRFHVGAPLTQDLLEDPNRYFHKLQARGALFDEETHSRGAIASGWMYVGLYVLAGLFFGAACGYLAVSRSMPALPWFFAGLLGNVAGLIVLLTARRGDPATAPAGIPPGLAKVAATHSPVACGSCGTLNHPSARACSGCNASLEPSLSSEVQRLRQQREGLS